MRKDDFAGITTAELERLRDYYRAKGFTACLAHAEAVLAGR